MGPLQGLGIATMLIGVGEQRVRARGLAFAALGVEDNNPEHADSTSGSATRRPAASTHHGNTKTTTASSGCTKPRSRSCASACNARALATPRAAVNPDQMILPFHLQPADDRPHRRITVRYVPRCW
jgi:hypothetical protein